MLNNLAIAKSEALFNIYSFLKENIKLSNTRDKVKTTRTVKNNSNRSNWQKKKTLQVQHTFSLISIKQLCTCSTLFCTFPCRYFARLKRQTSFIFLFARFMEKMFVFLFLFSLLRLPVRGIPWGIISGSAPSQKWDHPGSGHFGVDLGIKGWGSFPGPPGNTYKYSKWLPVR